MAQNYCFCICIGLCFKEVVALGGLLPEASFHALCPVGRTYFEDTDRFAQQINSHAISSMVQICCFLDCTGLVFKEVAALGGLLSDASLPLLCPCAVDSSSHLCAMTAPIC